MLWSLRLAIAVVLSTLLAFPLSAQQPATDLYGDPLPPGAIARLGTIRFRSGRFPSGLAFLPDSKTFVTVSREDIGIQFWEAETGRLLREISVEPMTVEGFAISRDGKQFAVAGFWYPEDRSQGAKGEVRVLDAASGEGIRRFPRDSRDVNRSPLAFTPDGELLVSLGNEGALRIEEIDSGTEILQQKLERDNSPFLTLSPNGQSIAVATGPNTRKLYLWKWQAGEEPQQLTTNTEQGGDGSLVFSPDSRHVAWAGTRNDPLHVWEVDSGKLAARLEPQSGEEYWHGAIRFAPDGTKLLASAGRNRQRGSIHVWNTSGWKYDRAMPIDARDFAISSDGRLLTTGSQVYNLETGQEFGANDAAHREQINRILTMPGGEAVTASQDGTIRMWDLATSKQKLKLTHDSWVRDIALSPDGIRLVSSSLDDTVRLWNLSTGKEIYRLPGHGKLGGCRAVGFSDDGQSCYSFGDDFYLRTWDVRTGKALAEHKLQPTGIKVPTEENRDSGEFDFFHIDAARISPGGKYLVLGLGKYFVFDVATGKEMRVLENDGSHISSIDFSPDGRLLLATAWGKSMQITLADGRFTSTTAKEQPLTIWELESGTRVKSLLLPGEGIRSAVFSPDGNQFAVVSIRPKHKITFYDLGGNEQFSIDEIPRRVSTLAFTPDGSKLIGGLEDTSALVWDLPSLRKK